MAEQENADALVRSRFIAYFRLVEACDESGCPVCRCLRESTLRALDALLYEQVTDPGTRGVLSESWGFCGWHAGMAREIPNAGLGVAIIYQDLLGQARARLIVTRRQLAGRRLMGRWRRLLGCSRWLALVRARASRMRCPLCRLVGTAETGYLHTLVEHVTDPEFDQVYSRSEGVCLPHLTLALGHNPTHPGAASLVDRTLGNLDQIAKQLRGFIDKHDHQQHAAFSDDEAASWTRALGFLVGDAALFGHEIPRRGWPSRSAPAASARPEAEPTRPPAEPLAERLQSLAFERRRLEQRFRDLMKRLGDESSRAAALHHRLWAALEDRKVVEMNLAGERAAARTWESEVHRLRGEIAELRARVAKYEPPAADAS